jgi:hypothetical protein
LFPAEQDVLSVAAFWPALESAQSSVQEYLVASFLQVERPLRDADYETVSLADRSGRAV